MSSIMTMVRKIVGLPKVTEEMMKEAGYEKLDINSSEDYCVLARFALISEADRLENGQKVETIVLSRDDILKSGIIGYSIERLDHTEYKILRTGSRIDSITEEVVDPYDIDDYIEIKESIDSMRNEENIIIARTIPGSTIGIKIDDSIYLGSIQNNKMIFEEKIKGEHEAIIGKMFDLIIKLLISDRETITKS
ncbi:hypothetical protein KAS31_02720 [Candidatus Parcubacteria bacterium]|nr:hypothetical protein [Candidatus Parcubacteria bacterium]